MDQTDRTYSGGARLDWSDWHDPQARDETVRELSPFLLLARAGQRPPPGDWRTWLFLGGRGAGKTRTGAEWICFGARHGGRARQAIIGATFADVREVMIEGPSGLRAVHPGRDEELPRYEVGRRRVLFANGAEVMVFSAGEPDSLRGPQFEAAWCDEVAAWPLGGEAWDMMQLALRLGDRPQVLATTTPRPTPLVRRLVAERLTRVTRSTTAENAGNLAPGFVEAMRSMYGHGRLARQELDGEIVEDIDGAFWTFSQIEETRASHVPARFDDLVVAVDPPASLGPSADACGIVAAGRTGPPGRGKCFILADSSAQGLRPMDWAGRAAALAASVGAVRIVAEGNQGGEMVRELLRAAGAPIPVELVHARVSKRARAGPVSAFYAQGQVHHVGRLTELEQEMQLFGTSSQAGSPDRVDALVWAVWALMIEGQGAPRVRTL